MLVGMGLEVPWFLWRQVDLTMPKRNAAGKHLEFPLTITFRACSSIGLGCFPGVLQLFHHVFPKLFLIGRSWPSCPNGGCFVVFVKDVLHLPLLVF